MLRYFIKNFEDFELFKFIWKLFTNSKFIEIYLKYFKVKFYSFIFYFQFLSASVTFQIFRFMITEIFTFITISTLFLLTSWKIKAFFLFIQMKNIQKMFIDLIFNYFSLFKSFSYIFMYISTARYNSKDFLNLIFKILRNF